MATRKATAVDLRFEHADPRMLRPDPRNPRRISDEAREKLRAGIERFGMVDPLLVRAEDSTVIGGHQRLAIALELGWQRVPVIRKSGLTVPEAHALSVLLNNARAQGEWDTAALANLLAEIRNEGIDLEVTGFGEDDLASMLAEARGVIRENEEEVDLEPPAKPKSRTGQVFELGSHRLVCGDATDPKTVVRAVGAGEVECLWTDPPYGVSYVGKTARRLKIRNDDKDVTGLLSGAFASADRVLAPSARFYIAAPAGPAGTGFRLALGSTKWAFHQSLVWVKDSMVLGHSDYHYRHEDILYGWKPGLGRAGRGNHKGTRWYGDHAQTTVLEFPKPSRSEDHPTMKPVALVRYCLENSTRQNDLVLDLFGGSGSTLIAAEESGRRAALVELDPAYCDVIRRRYAALVNDPKLSP